jgi:hypothetical protein
LELDLHDPNEFWEGILKGLTPTPDLHKVQPTLSPLALAHEALGLVEPFCKVYLGYPGIQASLTQQVEKNPVFA